MKDFAHVTMDRMLVSGLPIIGKPMLIYTASIHGLSGSNDFSDWRCRGMGDANNSGNGLGSERRLDSRTYESGCGIGAGTDVGCGLGNWHTIMSIDGNGFGICTDCIDSGGGNGCGYGDGTPEIFDGHGDIYQKYQKLWLNSLNDR